MSHRAVALRPEASREHAQRDALVTLAGIALLLATLIYMFSRPAGSSWLLPAPLNFGILLDMGTAGQGLPTLFHAYAFVLLSAAVLRPRLRVLCALCMSWFVLEAAFELGQLPAIAHLLETVLPDSLARGQLLRYFQLGVFDPLDVVFALVGVVAAGITVVVVFDTAGEHRS
jgi:hypothetical protein